ncbi:MULTISPECIES: hypothetical protein [unclassified Nocardiopsis]|uniref:hypothetical protein n=1 Tax=unclassified Nocardiopsis TaxID=2649073 RepID=UPI0019154B2B|nr:MULTISPECIES: hypothetical protein [unclassified Nocardiopsis]
MDDGTTIGRARAEDVAAIVAMLADDPLGARRFYERLGYTASHVGFKKDLG